MTYYRYTPEAWLIACEMSEARSKRRRKRLRRYAVLLNLTVFLLAAAVLAGFILVTGTLS